MKNLWIVIILGILAYSAHAEKPPVIPQGIKYIKTSEKINQDAVQILKKLFSGKATDKEVLSILENNTLWCGPYLWNQIKNDKAMSKLKKGKVNFRAPLLDNDGNIIRMEKYEGKLFQSKDEVLAFWKAFSNKIDFSDLKVRKLNPKELKIYWAMISWDITEPLFILESKNHKILVVFTSPNELTITWIDDYAIDSHKKNTP